MKKILVVGGLGFIGYNFIKTSIYQKKQYEFVSIDILKDKLSEYNVYINKNNVFQIANAEDSFIMNKIYSYYKPDITLLILSNEDALDVHSQMCDEYNSTLYTFDDYFRNFSLSNKHNTIKHCKLFGPRKRIDDVVMKSISSIVKKEEAIFNESGASIDEWLYINDFVKALQTIIDSDSVNNYYEISGGYEFSNVEIAQKIIGSNTMVWDNSKIYKNEYDSTLIKSLGWSVEGNFLSALKDTVFWYKNNEWWLNGASI